MPFEIIKKNNKFLVVNKDTGALRGTHNTREKAVAQLRLLYYLLNSGKIKGGKLNNQDDIYLELSKQAYIKKNDRSLDVDGYLYDKENSTERTAVYVNPEKESVIIAHRGTVKSSKSDLKQDALILAGLFDQSERLKNSYELVKNVMSKYPLYTISNTGHSLGFSIASEIGKKLPYKHSKVVGFNIGASPVEIASRLKDKAYCTFSNSEHCKKLKNQTSYTTGIDPISLSGLINAGETKLIKPKSFNVHSLSNF